MDTKSQRFIGLNTEDRLEMLQRAWEEAGAGANTLLPQLRQLAKQAREFENEDIQTSASNSHSAGSHQPGMATAAAAEKTRAWHQIIEAFQTTRQFLVNCSLYGLDAFQTSHNGCFPNPLPTPVSNPVLLDTFGKWAQLCLKYGDQFVTSAIIGAALTSTTDADGAVYLWLLDHPSLLNITRGVTEQRGDYTETIIGRTGGVVYA